MKYFRLQKRHFLRLVGSIDVVEIMEMGHRGNGRKVPARRISEGTKESRSNVFKLILYSLLKKRHLHILYWINKEDNELGINFYHKGSPNWQKKFLSLFEESDKLSPRYWKYCKESTYDCNCKVRFEANLRKLCEEKGPLQLVQTHKDPANKYITLRKYKIKSSAPDLLDGWHPHLVKNHCLDTEEDRTIGDEPVVQCINMVESNGSESVQMSSNTAVLPFQTVEEQTHYLCLSTQQVSNFMINDVNSEHQTNQQLYENVSLTENSNLNLAPSTVWDQVSNFVNNDVNSEHQTNQQLYENVSLTENRNLNLTPSTVWDVYIIPSSDVANLTESTSPLELAPEVFQTLHLDVRANPVCESPTTLNTNSSESFVTSPTVFSEEKDASLYSPFKNEKTNIEGVPDNSIYNFSSYLSDEEMSYDLNNVFDLNSQGDAIVQGKDVFLSSVAAIP